MEAMGAAGGISIAGGLALGLLALYLYRSKPHAMVGVSVALQVRISNLCTLLPLLQSNEW